MLFYRLLLATAVAIQKGEIRIGVSQSEILEYMSLAELKSERACRGILREALGEKHLYKTNWWLDARVKVIFLSPSSISDYVLFGLPSHLKSATEADLPQINARLEQEKNDKLKSLAEIFSQLPLFE